MRGGSDSGLTAHGRSQSFRQDDRREAFRSGSWCSPLLTWIEKPGLIEQPFHPGHGARRSVQGGQKVLPGGRIQIECPPLRERLFSAHKSAFENELAQRLL